MSFPLPIPLKESSKPTAAAFDYPLGAGQGTVRMHGGRFLYTSASGRRYLPDQAPMRAPYGRGSYRKLLAALESTHDGARARQRLVSVKVTVLEEVCFLRPTRPVPTYEATLRPPTQTPDTEPVVWIQFAYVCQGAPPVEWVAAFTDLDRLFGLSPAGETAAMDLS